jgi:hypothetical protein
MLLTLLLDTETSVASSLVVNLLVVSNEYVGATPVVGRLERSTSLSSVLALPEPAVREAQLTPLSSI